MQFKEITLADCAKKIIDNRGKTCPVGDSGMPLIATNCVKNDLLYPAYETTRFVSDSTYETWFRGHPDPGDIIFVTKGSPGRVCLAPNPVDFCIAQDMVSIRADNEKIYPKYLFAALRSAEVQHRIENMHVGTMIPHFKKGDFDKLWIPIPPRPQQVVVGDTYFELSARIELLRRTSITLEAIAQVLFKSWFIDFDPVRAKAEGREPDGMDAATAALFPDSFEDSPLGLIPQGWRTDEIGNVVNCIGGATPSTKEPSFWEPAEYHWVTPKDLSGLAAPVLMDTSRKVSAAGLKRISSGTLPEGTLLLSSRAPIGYLAIARIPTAINQGFIAMPPGGKLPPAYLLFWTQWNMDSIKQKANGSTFMEISKSAFRPIKLCVPSKKIVRAFASIAEPLLERIAANEAQRTQLAQLRDTLLPRLISGKVRLPEARTLIEEATP